MLLSNAKHGSEVLAYIIKKKSEKHSFRDIDAIGEYIQDLPSAHE